jgi:predicted transcriptional regulator
MKQIRNTQKITKELQEIIETKESKMIGAAKSNGETTLGPEKARLLYKRCKKSGMVNSTKTNATVDYSEKMESIAVQMDSINQKITKISNDINRPSLRDANLIPYNIPLKPKIYLNEVFFKLISNLIIPR